MRNRKSAASSPPSATATAPARPARRSHLARNLLLLLVPLVVGPFIVAAPFLFRLAESDITNQIVGQLTALATAQQDEITQWAAARAGDMRNLAAAPDVQTAAHGFVFEESGPQMAAAGDQLRERFERYLSDNPDFEALLLVDSHTGDVLITTYDFRYLVGESLAGEAYFDAARVGALMAPFHHYPQIDPEHIHLVAAAPVVEAGRGTIAVVVGLIPDARLVERLATAPGPFTSEVTTPNGVAGAGGGMTENSRLYLLSAEGYELGQGAGPQAAKPQSEGIQKGLVNHQDGNGVYIDQYGEYVVGVYKWLPGFEAALMLEENEDAAFLSLTRFSIIFAVIGALAVLVSGAGVLLFTRRLARPIQQLTANARRMAGGDLTGQESVSGRTDEIGELSEAFNSMARQLRESLDTLEQRVSDRTVELARASEQMRYRAAQLETVAETARAVVAEQELEQLLPLVTQLISERFHFYHVGVFLLDETSEFAVLEAANSEGGQRMLARNHKLRVGQTGIVGYVAGRGQARIALDVGQDAVFFDNPDLPLTRSEMAVPLKVHGEVIGVLDVQSQQPAAFTEEDANLLGILADQVAIAIQNARLLAGTRQALAQVQQVHRQYLEQEWGRLVAQRGPAQVSYLYTPAGVTADPELASLGGAPEARQALQAGRVVVANAGHDGGGSGNGDASARAVLAVPIMLRGQVIGVIDLQRPAAVPHTSPLGEGKVRGGSAWSEEEVALVQTVTDELALALENARLLEDTMRRAQRERTIAGITDRIYTATDARSILHIAAEELRRITGSARAVVRLNREANPEAQAPARPPESLEQAKG